MLRNGRMTRNNNYTNTKVKTVLKSEQKMSRLIKQSRSMFWRSALTLVWLWHRWDRLNTFSNTCSNTINIRYPGTLNHQFSITHMIPSASDIVQYYNLIIHILIRGKTAKNPILTWVCGPNHISSLFIGPSHCGVCGLDSNSPVLNNSQSHQEPPMQEATKANTVM